MKQENYSVAALASAVGVPRTTINDWLVRYENYIDSIPMGKRKVYPTRSLMVLQEVARLRDEGKSSVEIENILAQMHGIKPEVANAATPETTSAHPAPAVPETSDPTAFENSSEDVQLPALQKFERNAIELTRIIVDLRQLQQRTVRRSQLTIWMLMTVIILLAAGAVFAGMHLRRQQQQRELETLRMRESMTKLSSDFVTELQKLETLRQTERQTAEKQAAALKNELTELHRQRSAEIELLRKQLAEERQALQQELQFREQKLAEQNARERQTLLEKFTRDSQLSEQRLGAVQSQLDAAGKSLSELNKQLQQLNKQSNDRMIVQKTPPVIEITLPESSTPPAGRQNNPPESTAGSIVQ